MNELYIVPKELHVWLAAANPPTVIDVRGDEEFAAGHIPGALHRASDQLASGLAEIPRDRPVVTY